VSDHRNVDNEHMHTNMIGRRTIITTQDEAGRIVYEIGTIAWHDSRGIGFECEDGEVIATTYDEVFAIADDAGNLRDSDNIVAGE
jgi:hypothetical protein